MKHHIFKAAPDNCAIYVSVKLERLNVLSQVNHFALPAALARRVRVYLKALQASFGELGRLQFETAA